MPFIYHVKGLCNLNTFKINSYHYILLNQLDGSH